MLVVEDVVTTGGSTRETMDVARAAGADGRRAPARSSIAAAATRGSTCRFARCCRWHVQTYQPESVPAVRGRAERGQARLAHSGAAATAQDRERT